MLLSIIIVNWNTAKLLKQYLKNIANLNLNFAYEIIVIDNNSKDDSAKMIKQEFPQTKLIANQKNLGISKGNNQGIKASQGKYVLISNTDIVIPKNSLEKIIDFLEQEKNHHIVLVGPKLINPDKTRQDSCFRNYNKLHWLTQIIFPAIKRTSLQKYKFAKKPVDYFLYRDKKFITPFRADWVMGSFMLGRKKAFNNDQIGLFDERLNLFLSEPDWCQRAIDQGKEIWYYPDTHVIHYPHRASAGSLNKLFSRTTRIHISDWFKYFIKWRILKHQNTRT